MIFILMGEEVALLCIFHDHVEVVSLQDGLPEFYDVGVIEIGVQVDLAFD